MWRQAPDLSAAPKLVQTADDKGADRFRDNKSLKQQNFLFPCIDSSAIITAFKLLANLCNPS